jgi:hypothetical protein
MSNVSFGTPYPEKVETENLETLEIDAGFLRFHVYPTPEDVLKIGLLGVPKRFPMTGEEITPEYITDMMAAAIADIEMTGLTISPAVFTKQEDFHEGMLLQNFFPIMVNKYPVLAVESVIFVFPHATLPDKDRMLRYIVPKHWISWERAKINVIASTGPLLPQMTGTQYNSPLALWTNTNYRPNAYTATWQAGFQPDKLPYNVWRFIVDKTAFNILSDIGPLLFPISGMSVGIDGLSQSSQFPAHRLLEGRLAALDMRIRKTENLIQSYYGQRLNMSFAGM